MEGTSKVTQEIVFGNPLERKYLTEPFMRSCTDDELNELYETLYGWTTLIFYSDKFKQKLRKAMKMINSIQKERNRLTHKKNK